MKESMAKLGFGLCVAISGVLLLTTESAASGQGKQATEKTCWEVECVGSCSQCIILGDGDGITITIPGCASTNKVPCPVIGGSYTHTGPDFWIEDPVAPFGVTEGAAGVHDQQKTGDFTEFDTSTYYTDYSAWLDAATN